MNNVKKPHKKYLQSFAESSMIMSERVTGGTSGKTTGSTFLIEPTAWASLF
jgi:hypothetical protein